jgi:hypothetical protein
MIHGWCGGSATASSADSKPVMSHRSPVPNTVIAPRRDIRWCTAAKTCLPALVDKQAAPFIDYSGEIWNFDRDRPAYSLSLLPEKGKAMRKTLMALAAAGTLAVSALAAPAPAQAQRGVGAGIAAGLIGGAIVGGAIASQNGYYGPGYYGPGYGYYGGPAYVADPGYDDAPCVWQRQRFWDGYGWRVRRVRVCD